MQLASMALKAEDWDRQGLPHGGNGGMLEKAHTFFLFVVFQNLWLFLSYKII